MAASQKICVSRRGSGKYGWVGDDVGLHLGVTSAPVGGVQPVPLPPPILSMARHHPSGENTLWPDITQPTTRRNRRLKIQKSNPLAIHCYQERGDLPIMTAPPDGCCGRLGVIWPFPSCYLNIENESWRERESCWLGVRQLNSGFLLFTPVFTAF